MSKMFLDVLERRFHNQQYQLAPNFNNKITEMERRFIPILKRYFETQAQNFTYHKKKDFKQEQYVILLQRILSSNIIDIIKI